MQNQRFAALTIILMGMIWLCFPVAPAVAETTQVLQVEATIATVSAEWLPVGDEPGHVVGMTKGEGTAVLSNGETAKYSNVSTFDTRRGKGGTSEGYTKFAFDDGSSIFFYWTAQIAVGQDGLSSSKGEGTIIKGTGRFTGIEGTSVFSSKVKMAQDATRTTVANATITYTLP